MGNYGHSAMTIDVAYVNIVCTGSNTTSNKISLSLSPLIKYIQGILSGHFIFHCYFFNF